MLPLRQVRGFIAKERLRRVAAFLFLTLVVLLEGVRIGAQSPSPVTLIKAGRLLDPRSGNVLAPAAVLIEGNKVKQIGSPQQIGVSAGARVIDLGTATLLPGLI